MRNDIDCKKMLHLYNLISSHGVKQSDHYLYEGIRAWSDFDGYTVYLASSTVSISLFFHGKYHADYSSRSEFEAFLKQTENAKVRIEKAIENNNE